ncbi:two-component system regulatory protein YycI [Bacillus sp. J37]|uniref:two-component system regulatory protein YycI n=1 Tax=Bacillus sp. J37 TaxID=935837 RepID=UPI00047B5E65|nr:two-component system regulatory protein YycI [Bacillus sp. J37]
MDWSKTKTIFILAFLILDIYLAMEFFELQDKSDYAIIQEATIEERLAAEGIEYPDDLPDDINNSFYITAKSKDFTIEEVAKLKGQTIELPNTNFEEDQSFRTLNMLLDKPFPLPDVNTESKITQFLNDNIISGELYHYWYTDEEMNSIICIQSYNSRTIFQSKDDHIGMVVLHLNEDNEIISYEQSMLEQIKEVEEKEAAITALKAIEALYNKNYLSSNSEVVKIEYGYYTHSPLSNQQILAPTWHLTVEKEDEESEDFYVNALEGDVLQLTE